MKSILNRFHKKLAQLGRSMLVPVTAMPIAGILSRIASPDMLSSAPKSCWRYCIWEHGHFICIWRSRCICQGKG